MVKINFLNEKGNVSAKVRTDVKAQAVKSLKVKLGEEVLDNEVGGLSVQIAEDTVTGNPVYANYEVVISNNLPKKSEKDGKKKVAVVADTIPNLFEE